MWDLEGMSQAFLICCCGRELVDRAFPFMNGMVRWLGMTHTYLFIG